MRLAVCISGQPRAVATCVESLRENLLGGLPCDFFVHSWCDSRVDRVRYEDLARDVPAWKFWRHRTLRRRHRRIGEWVGQVEATFPTQREEIEALLERAYAPVRLAVEPQERFDLSGLEGAPRYIRGGTTLTNMMSMFRSIQRANELKRGHEERHRFRYDCVVRCRTDLFFFQPFPLMDYLPDLEKSVLVPEEQNYTGVNDQLAVATSANMDAYADAFDSIVPFYRGGGRLHPETFLAAHLADNGLAVRHGPIDYEIVRGTFGSPAEYLAARAAGGTARPTP